MLKCLKDDRQIYGINVAELSTAEDKEEQQQQEPLNQENSNFTMDDVTRNLVPDLLGDFQVSSSTDIMKDEPDEDNWMNKSSNNFPSDPSGDRQVPEVCFSFIMIYSRCMNEYYFSKEISVVNCNNFISIQKTSSLNFLM